MKKLNLGNFNNAEVLTRAELKELTGGDFGSGSGGANSYFCQCRNGNNITISNAPTVQAATEIANSICIPYVVACHPSY